jgi:hypothetical protein
MVRKVVGVFVEVGMSLSNRQAPLEFFQQVYAFGKAGVSDRHYHIDRIEVFFTRKTSCQVDSGIYRSVKFPAQGTAKAEGAVSDFRRKLQEFLDDFSNGNEVADGA